MAKSTSTTRSKAHVSQLAVQRVSEFLAECRSGKLSQAEVAQRLGIPAQYLSDYKAKRRKMSESVARRVEEVFGIHWKWIMGRSDDKEAVAQVAGAVKKSDGVWLPVFGYPIEGDPRTHLQWEGMTAEVVGPAAAKVKQATSPYLLTYHADDHRGIIRSGDLLLMSQAAVVTRSNIEEVVQVIHCGRRAMFLVRRTNRGWQRISQAFSSTFLSFDECTVKGHAMAIVYRPLI